MFDAFSLSVHVAEVVAAHSRTFLAALSVHFVGHVGAWFDANPSLVQIAQVAASCATTEATSAFVVASGELNAFGVIGASPIKVAKRGAA